MTCIRLVSKGCAIKLRSCTKKIRPEANWTLFAISALMRLLAVELREPT